jgi:hypothetical protein
MSCRSGSTLCMHLPTLKCPRTTAGSPQLCTFPVARRSQSQRGTCRCGALLLLLRYPPIRVPLALVLQASYVHTTGLSSGMSRNWSAGAELSCDAACPAALLLVNIAYDVTRCMCQHCFRAWTYALLYSGYHPSTFCTPHIHPYVRRLNTLSAP